MRYGVCENVIADIPRSFFGCRNSALITLWISTWMRGSIGSKREMYPPLLPWDIFFAHVHLKPRLFGSFFREGDDDLQASESN